MKGSNQFVVAFRRMSIVYTFLVVTAIILLVYYYYVIPGKKAEFAERSSRALKTLVNSYQKEIEDLKSSFSQKSLSRDSNVYKLIRHQDSYQRLYENVHYEADTTWKPLKQQERIEYKNGWKLVFALDSTKWLVQVPLQEFSNKIFVSRADVFNSFILLLPDTNQSALGKSPPWHIVYKQSESTTSDLLLLDSSQSLFSNSDMSTVVEATIGGRSQKIFLNAFNLENQIVILGGLIPKSKYDHYVHSISTNLIVAVIIFIIVLLIVLPLLKIYFLSRNETVYSRDVIASSISIFIGTAAILLILIFGYLYSISSESFHNRMHDIGNQISADIERQLDSAGKQLDRYVYIYDSLSSDSDKKVLTYSQTDSVIINHIDSLFYPSFFPHLKRVYWVDSLGETLAKWNPFDYKTPLTNVKDQEYFKRLKAISDQNKQSQRLIVYTGKSHLTGEFLVYIGRPARQKILAAEKNNKNTVFVQRNSMGIFLITSLYCNTFPVLPAGFSFCLFDNTGNVLLHSDETRNLAENFFEETRNNSQLISNAQQKTHGVIRNVALYGAQHDIVIEPIRGQPLSIAVFYPTQRIISNISRFLHFSIACLVGLFAIIILFILYLTYRNSRPSQLRFRLNKVQWIRPAAGNRYAYRFSQWYFFTLITVSFLSFVCIQALDFDFRDVLYLSVLLPFYAFIGMITANQKLINAGADQVLRLKESYKKTTKDIENAYKESFGSLFAKLYELGTHPLMLPALLIVFLNLQFFYFLWGDKKFCMAVSILVFVQATFIWAFVFFYRKNRDRLNKAILERTMYLENEIAISSENLIKDETANSPISAEIKGPFVNGEKVPNNYLWSLYFVLILVTVLPTFGIATYAFFAEKTQYKKAKELLIAQQLDRKFRYLRWQYKSNYKPNLIGIDSIHRPDSALLLQGNYLSDHDRIEIKDPPQNISSTIYDEPYQVIINHMYTYTSPLFGEFAIKNISNDSATWKFASQNDSLILYYQSPLPGSRPLTVSSYYQNPLQNFSKVFWQGGFFFPIVIIFFLAFLFWYLGSTIRRLFLLNFSKPCEVSRDFLNKYFEGTQTDPLYPNDSKKPVTTAFFADEERLGEEYILKMNFSFLPVYTNIWNDLSEKEKYILFDLSRDGYTNYKNTDVLFQLLTKGILKYEDYKLKFFSLSFQNFVLGQRDDSNMQEVIAKYNVGGMWSSLRVPVLLISGLIAVFVVLTQSDVAHDLTAFITSIVALIPLLIQLFGRNTARAGS